MEKEILVNSYVDNVKQVQVELKQYDKINYYAKYDIDKIVFDLNCQMDTLSSKADKFDYLISVASGILCAMLDILWVGEINLKSCRDIGNEKVEDFVKKTSKIMGCKNSDDIRSAVKFLEDKFPLASDGNTPKFGGGLQHHLRDFAHHPTITGLIFSLLTQFTYKSYGTDVNGRFIIVNIPEKSKKFIGKDVPEKILMGSINWFFHLVSDMAGSRSTAGLSGGTGIPGPLLSLAKELSTVPLFRNIKIKDITLSKFLSKLFNGTYLSNKDANGNIIKESILKFDLRTEIGLYSKLSQQAIPVIANECIVRGFYFIRHLGIEMKKMNVRNLEDMQFISWDKIVSKNNPTIDRMLTISTSVFTSIDIGHAIASQGFWINVNFPGVIRCSVAIGKDISWTMKYREVKKIKKMYQDIMQFSYRKIDDNIYKRIGENMSSNMSEDENKFGLTIEETEILYNIEYYKVLNDIKKTMVLFDDTRIVDLKKQWLNEWRQYMSKGFESFTQVKGAKLQWYNSEKILKEKISKNNPREIWLRLVLLEAMLFEPYFPLDVEKNKKGENIPSKKYKKLENPLNRFNIGEGDKYLNLYFTGEYCEYGYVTRLRKCYDKSVRELNEVLKSAIKTLTITTVIAGITIFTAGALAPSIAVALVGSNFAGLSGAALTNACLAYLGGGAIAAGGAGMAGGTIAIVGGGAVLGIGIGAGVGGTVGVIGLMGKGDTIAQSAKLLVSVKEIFLNDEHDITYSDTIYEQYVQKIMNLENYISKLKIEENVSKGDRKKELNKKIKEAEKSLHAMRIAQKSMKKFNSSFKEGMFQGNK